MKRDLNPFLLPMAVILVFAILAGWALWVTDDPKPTAPQVAAPQTERAPKVKAKRVGEISVNRSTAGLWMFEFEGKQCLWVVLGGGRSANGGMTCWEDVK